MDSSKLAYKPDLTRSLALPFAFLFSSTYVYSKHLKTIVIYYMNWQFACMVADKKCFFNARFNHFFYNCQVIGLYFSFK
ncbi:hypothetical protein QVD17_24090 [Tagetes erecta]|uniref:Uncharacterized protein n=1 Tax=Tagetes erecta TaxID=13708 RepID=A0AAD8KL61_TARER|nr:hypothetical protein QVD17_24090 [Tagetes erecta]